MKGKINSRFEINNYTASNDIYRKFRYQFDALLNPNERIASSAQLDEIYVHDTEFEKEIEYFKDSATSQLQFVIGYTGIGKTTSLRHCFGLRINNAPIYREKRKELILPTFFDAHNDIGMTKEDAINALAKRIQSVCSFMEDEFDDIGLLFSGEREKKDSEDFYNFIKSYKPEIVQDVEEFNLHRTKREKIYHGLKTAFSTDKFAFFAMKLKYYISLKRDKISRFTLVVDDIESLHWKYQMEVIDSYLSLYECLFNTVEDTENPCITNMLISIRPITARLLNNYIQVDAYPVGPEILKRSISISEMFQKRFNYYTCRNDKMIGNVETWQGCYDELMRLTDRFDNKFSNMIMELNCFNIRDTLKCYAMVLGNRRWIQCDKKFEEYFQIRFDEYKFNNITVLRSLACQENCVYSENSKSPVPNVLLTGYDYDYSLYILLIIRYFVIRQDNIEFYGMNSISIAKILEDFKRIGVDGEADSWLIESIVSLFEKKIFRKSFKDSDRRSTVNTRESLSKDSKIYLSPRGFAIWKMFSSDSVLLEMYREDMNIDDSYADEKGRNFSFLASCEQAQVQTFEELLKLIKYYCIEEWKFRKKYREGKTAEYDRLFSSDPVVKMIFQGVNNSIQYSNNSGNESLKMLQDEIVEYLSRM